MGVYAICRPEDYVFLRLIDMMPSKKQSTVGVAELQRAVIHYAGVYTHVMNYTDTGRRRTPAGNIFQPQTDVIEEEPWASNFERYEI